MIKKEKILLIIVLFFCLIILYILTKSEFSKKPKIILLGIDAAEWNVIDPLIDEGKLPNFKKMKQEGGYGYLISPYAFSPISWTEIATGKTKEKHGIYDFFNDNKTKITSGDEVKSKRIWNILNEHGKTTGIFQWLITWPTESVNGFMISDELAQNVNITYPTQLSEDLKINNIEPNYTIKEITNVMLYLLKTYPTDFFAGNDYKIHALEHFFWKYWEPEKFGLTNLTQIEEYRKILVNAYEEYDIFLGNLEKLANKESIIFIVSDHGMKMQMPVVYHIDFTGLLKELDLLNYTFENILPGSKITQITYSIGEISNNTYQVDFLILNETTNKITILQNLLKVTYEGTNKTFFSNYYLKNDNLITLTFDEEILKDNIKEDTTGPYPKTYVSLYLPSGNISNLYIYEKSGEHPPGTNGIILVKGPMIKQGYEIINATTYDIAPTILYLYGIPIPNDMDGRVLTEIIKDDFLKKHPIQYSNVTSQKQEKINETLKINQTMAKEIEEKLRELGYIN